MQISIFTCDLLEENKRYDKILSKIVFGHFSPIYVYESMIDIDKKKLSPNLKGLDYLFSNLMKDGYVIDVFIEKESFEISNYLKSKENFFINIKSL